MVLGELPLARLLPAGLPLEQLQGSLTGIGLVSAVGGALLLCWFTRSLVFDLIELNKFVLEGAQAGAQLEAPPLRLSEFQILGKTISAYRFKQQRQDAEVSQLVSKLGQRNQEMKQFVYTVSHDLKSPLVTCQGYITLMQEDYRRKDYDSMLESSEQIAAACRSIGTTIEGLLELSQIGLKLGTLQNVEVADMLDELQRAMAHRLKQAGAELRVQHDLPAVLADRRALSRAFENLVSNALKYGCRDKGAVISIGAVETGEALSYFVKDNGPGIPRRYHEKIFQLFERIEPGDDGSGIGLATVAKIMQVHNGRAWVESEPGKGATFWLSFPRMLAEAAEWGAHA